MAFVINDRVKETTTTTGTGDITFGGAVQGYETFAAGIGNSDTTYYAIYNPGTTEFEVGLGTLSGDSSTMARTTVISSSNSDNAVDFSAGTKDIFCTLPASKAIVKDDGDDVKLGDDEKLIFGAGSDLQIYHDTTANHSYISESGSGDLIITGANIRLENGSSEYYIRTYNNGQVELYHNNSKKLETTSTGVQTTGTVSVNGAYTFPTTDGTSTQILQTDGSGALTFVDKPTSGASNGFVIAMAVAL